MAMLHDMAAKVKATGADVGLAFDGDGDRCGVVDNLGREIFADTVGVMLARDISGLHRNAKFVVDVKSTGLFLTDPVLKANGATTAYWKTGHSYIKRYSHETKALVGFEKSGHFFFSPPLGRGYDDGLIAALAVCDMLERNPDKTMADLRDALPKTWQSPTMSPHCDDEKKYGIVDAVVAHYTKLAADGGKVAGQKIRDLVTVNGVRIVLEDGTWGLVRASSNKPELVVVVESPTSEANMKAIFADIDRELGKVPRGRRLQSEDRGLIGTRQKFSSQFQPIAAIAERHRADAILRAAVARFWRGDTHEPEIGCHGTHGILDPRTCRLLDGVGAIGCSRRR